jgi:hypothetical protein
MVVAMRKLFVTNMDHACELRRRVPKKYQRRLMVSIVLEVVLGYRAASSAAAALVSV